MPEETTTDKTTAQTSEGEGQGTAQNTADASTGTDTQAATSEATDKKFTQAEVDAMFAKRLPKAVKAELRKMSGETDGQPSVDEYKSRAEAAEERARNAEARESVRDHLTDPKNRIGALPDNMRAIEKLIMAELEYDDDGKPKNLPDAIKTVKSDAPGLFLQTGSANGGAGRQAPVSVDMNALIRGSAGRTA